MYSIEAIARGDFSRIYATEITDEHISFHKYKHCLFISADAGAFYFRL